jgi:hypothetical protein
MKKYANEINSDSRHRMFIVFDPTHGFIEHSYLNDTELNGITGEKSLEYKQDGTIIFKLGNKIYNVLINDDGSVDLTDVSNPPIGGGGNTLTNIDGT